MSLPASFSNNTTPTGQQLDQNFAALGALTPIPCVYAGTNTVALTPRTGTPTVVGYTNYIQFTGVVGTSNTGPVTVQVGAFAALQVYKDTALGPVVLTGGELVAGCAATFMYDSTLNEGAGGFHVSAQSSILRSHIATASITLDPLFPQTGTVVTVSVPGTSVNDVVQIGFPPSPSVGLLWMGYVPNAGTVVLSAFNTFSLATVTPTVGNYSVLTQGGAT